jgi:hypothetical protein
MNRIVLLIVLTTILLISYTIPEPSADPLRYYQLWDSIPADSGNIAVCLNPDWHTNDCGEIFVVFEAWGIDTLGPGTDFPYVYFYQTRDDNDYNYYYTQTDDQPKSTEHVLSSGSNEVYLRLTFGDHYLVPLYTVYGDSIFIQYNPRDAKSSGYISAHVWKRKFDTN